jgi:hypothetical protein
MQLGMPQATALKSTEKTDTALFEPERVTNYFRNWLPTYLIFTAIDIRDCTFTALPIVGRSTVSMSPIDFRCICKR